MQYLHVRTQGILQAYTKYGATISAYLASDMGRVVTEDFFVQVQDKMGDILKLEMKLAEVTSCWWSLLNSFLETFVLPMLYIHVGMYGKGK